MKRASNGYETVLPGPFANVKELNFGILLLAAYFLFDFGAFQGVFDIVSQLRLPFIIATMSVLYAGYLVIIRRIDFKSITTWRFFLLCGFIVLYAQFSTEVQADRKALLTLFAQYFANYLIFIACVKTPYQFIFLIDIWLLGILHSSYHAIHQGGKLYDSIWLKDENHISLLVAMAIPFALILFKQYHSKLKKLFYLTCLVFYVVANIIAASRGGALAMFIAGLLCLLLYDNKMRNLLIMSIAVLLVFLVFTYGPELNMNRSLSGRLTTTMNQGTQEETVNDRLYLWGLAIEMFDDNPILGVGPMNYPVKFYSYEKGQRYSERRGAWRVTHSTPLQWLAETGIIGSIIFILVQAALYKNWKIIYLMKKRIAALAQPKIQAAISDFNNISHACMISQVAFWIGALFLTLLPYPFFWCLIPFSEAWKNIYVHYVDAKVKTPTSPVDETKESNFDGPLNKSKQRYQLRNRNFFRAYRS
jgi:O-antigen ligase